MRRKILVAIAILAAGGFMWLLAQQKPGAWLPGGTPEENLWETLVLMGAGDQTPGRWNGTAQVSNGQMFALDGYRFDSADRILPQGGWEMQTKVETVLETSPIEGGGANAAKHRLLPKGVLIRGSGSGATRVAIETGQGTCSFLPIQMAFGAPEVCAGGRIEAMRIPPATDLSGTTARQHDFPSIAASGDGSLSVTWLSYHDRREELNFRRYQKGQWTRLIPVGRAVEDLWRPQVIADQSGAPWLIWSEQEKGNWDIYAMPWLDNDWGPRTKLSAEPAPDIEPHVARSADGVIYVVWQALAGRYSQIRMRYLKGGKWSPVIPVTS